MAQIANIKNYISNLAIIDDINKRCFSREYQLDTNICIEVYTYNTQFKDDFIRIFALRYGMTEGWKDLVLG